MDTTTATALVVFVVFVVLYVMRRKSRLDREMGGKH
jgi:hypothetical protein